MRLLKYFLLGLLFTGCSTAKYRCFVIMVDENGRMVEKRDDSGCDRFYSVPREHPFDQRR